MTLRSNTSGEATDDAVPVHLRVLATSDLHAHLLPFNYYRDQPDPAVGLMRVAERIVAERAGAANTLLLDNGDTLQGAPLGDAWLDDLRPAGRAHPMFAAMNALGYDAATLGNHDFDFGLEALETALGTAEFPVILANVRRRQGASRWPSRVILTRDVADTAGNTHDLRIGLVGVAPPQIAKWGRARLGDTIEVTDIADTVAVEVAALHREGADLVIVLAHSGLGAEHPEPGMENAATVVAALPGVDAVIAGHSHRVFPEAETTGARIVQPGAFGSHLGRIDLTLARQNGAWAVTGSTARTFPISERPGIGLRGVLRRHPGLRPILWTDHRAVRRYADRPLGQTAVPLETFFSFLAPCAATQIVADAQRHAAQELLANRPDLSGLPLLSAVAPFKSGGRGGPGNYTDIPAGPLRLRNAADLYIYPNQLCILRMTGAGIVAWLERTASLFRQITPLGPGAAPQPMIDHAFAGYNFDRIEGLGYRFDLSQPPRTNAEGDEIFDTPGRVRDLCHADGRPVAQQDQFLVVTNSYRAAGGGHFPACAEAETVVTSPATVRDAVIEAIATARHPITPRPTDHFGFTPLGNTPVLFETGPDAAAHAERAQALGLTPLGLQSSGFFGFRLDL